MSIAAWAPSEEVLIFARILGGLAAGMAYPTTLALITALWSGPARTRAIALWAATGGAIAALGPLCSGILLEHFWWGSVFLLTLPLAGIGLLLALILVPSHVNESTEPVEPSAEPISASPATSASSLAGEARQPVHETSIERSHWKAYR